jgi:hypothetical protein
MDWWLVGALGALVLHQIAFWTVIGSFCLECAGRDKSE